MQSYSLGVFNVGEDETDDEGLWKRSKELGKKKRRRQGEKSMYIRV